jgi:hypothetical protein
VLIYSRAPLLLCPTVEDPVAPPIEIPFRFAKLTKPQERADA